MTTDIDKRYQTLLLLWFALFMSIGLYFVIAWFAGPPMTAETDTPRRSILIATLTAAGTFLVVISFAVKRKYLERSVERQDVSLVQKGLVLGCALCEVCALLGLLERFLVGNHDYFVLFIIAAIGTAIHFPRREQLTSASYKTNSSEMDL